MTPPSGPLITLTGDATEREFGSLGFTTFASLQGTYPAGNYLLTLNGSETVTLAWNPTEPTGQSGQASLTITSPVGDVFDRMPDLVYTLDCTNCDDSNAEYLDVDTDGNFVEFEAEALSQPPPNPVLFSSFSSSNSLTELVAVDMHAEVLAGLAEFNNVALSPSGHSFQYVEAAAVFDESTFTRFTTWRSS